MLEDELELLDELLLQDEELDELLILELLDELDELLQDELLEL
jgi:hypothetical protein